MRLERSNLNLHKFIIGQSDTPECLCHAKNESSIHYLIDCFLYAGERRILFDLVEYYIPSFKTMNRNEKYKVLVMGIDPDNPEITQTNVSISIAVQKFFLKQDVFPNNPLYPNDCTPYDCQICFPPLFYSLIFVCLFNYLFRSHLRQYFVKILQEKAQDKTN